MAAGVGSSQAAHRPRVDRLSFAFRFLPQPLHAFGDLVVPVREQVTVGAERHAQIGVTELSLHHERVGGALCDHHRYAAVPERMWGEMGEPGAGYGRIPIASAEVAEADDLSLSRGEDKLAGRRHLQSSRSSSVRNGARARLRRLRVVFSCSV